MFFFFFLGRNFPKMRFSRVGHSVRFGRAFCPIVKINNNVLLYGFCNFRLSLEDNNPSPTLEKAQLYKGHLTPECCYFFILVQVDAERLEPWGQNDTARVRMALYCEALNFCLGRKGKLGLWCTRLKHSTCKTRGLCSRRARELFVFCKGNST